jgi:hypothetical protein
VKRWDGIYRIISPFIKRQGPDGRVHEGWCAIFEHCSCSCRDDGRGGGRRVRRDDGGTKVRRRNRESWHEALPKGKFAAIMADPPIPFDTWSRKAGRRNIIKAAGGEK